MSTRTPCAVVCFKNQDMKLKTPVLGAVHASHVKPKKASAAPITTQPTDTTK